MRGVPQLNFLKTKVLPWIKTHKIILLAALAVVILGIAAYFYRWEIEEKVMPPKPQAPRTVTISKTNLTLQELNTRSLTSEGVDRIVNFFVKNDVFYLARRSADGTTTTLAAFDLKDGTLYPHREFGVKGVVTFKNQKLFGLTLGENGDIYYVRKSVHTLRDGNDIESLKGQTTATRIALLPGENQAYLYGNDNFTLADIKDGAFVNNHPSFLHNRAKPFAGGVSLIQVMSNGNVYAGGRIRPNDFNIVACFSPKGKLMQYYGSYHQTDKDSIYNLVDMAILDRYIVVIDGFTLKLWKKDGAYMGSFNSSKLLGGDMNCAKLAVIDGNDLAILGYVRNAKTGLIDLHVFKMIFPDPQ
jgi:hypothetical protein